MKEPGHDDLASALAARGELGPEYDRQLIEGLAERMQVEIDRRVDERLGKWGVAGVASRRESRMAVPLGSLAIGVPLSAIGLIAGLSGLVLVWVGIVAVNVAHAVAQTRER